ncbi:MAG: helix-turn-helix domain-containing protein [Thermoplasmatota archaeon]
MLTEVFLELADTHCTFCRLTDDHASSWAIYRVIDTGSSSGPFRATVTFIAQEETRAAIIRDLRNSGACSDMEILAATPNAIAMRVSHAAQGAEPLKALPPAVVAAMVAEFGPDMVIEPMLIERGGVRLRILLAQAMETKRAVTGLQSVQRRVAAKQFRVIRISEFQARRYADVLRRVLSPDQEDLLRMALSMGYYDSPKGCTLHDLAAKLGVSVSPIHKKLKTIEQILVARYVTPGQVVEPAPPRRALRKENVAPANAPAPGVMAEAALRVRWPGFEYASFAAQTPKARVVFQPIGDFSREGNACGLAVIVAGPESYQPLLERVAKRSDVSELEIVSRDAHHATARVRSTLPPNVGWGGHINPFPRLVNALGREVFVKPCLMEGEDVWMKIVFPRNPGYEEFAGSLQIVADGAGWVEHEIISMRNTEADLAITGSAYAERMTARQDDVLRIAHALGYYRTPRDCTLEHIAKTLGTSANAIHKNLTSAEQKIVGEYLASGL